MERNQTLQQYTGWLHTVAGSMTDGPMHDDLVQEGYIAMWRALGSYDPLMGKLDYWLKRAATDRMRSVVTGGSMTTTLERKDTTGFVTSKGNDTRSRISEYVKQNPSATGVEIAKALGISEGTLSYQRKKMGTVATASVMSNRVVSLDAVIMDSEQSDWMPEGLWHHDSLDGIDVSYHAGEIYDALDCLTASQRKYVVARFWGGMNPVELRDLFGYDPNSLWKTAKPKLQLRLEYLREMVPV